MEEFTWLKEENDKMYCDICMMTGKKNAFTTTGCNNYQKSALERHQNSKDHTPFIGLMLYETCDISIEKKLAIYARYVNSETGSVNTSFVGNKRITNCTAAGIKDALCEFLKDKGLVQWDDYSWIVGPGTDGAAVMTGRHNGLGVKLKQLNNILIQVHCVASQASKDIDYLEQYKGQINSIYKFYSNSSVRYDKLKEIQKLMHGKVKQVVEPSSVRWLSVEACVKMIFEYFDSLVVFGERKAF